MTNAFKHSQATNVTLNMHRTGEQFFIELTDDGVGFTYSQITMNGLKNIQGRADRINAVLNTDGGPNEGTKVILSFVLNKTKKQKSYVKL
jgi:signal transduction histidine kinase